MGRVHHLLGEGRLHALEDAKTKPKKLLAETMLDNAMLKEIAAKIW
jgi:putative transposase